jgi:hypothetical protein
MRTRFLCMLAAALFVFRAPLLHAQAPSDLFSGPLDTLYSQAQAVSSLDPLWRSTALTTTSLA